MSRERVAERGIPLQQGVIYGPVYSRRIGRSLGINPLPTDCKVCVFDCIYCQYGRTDLKSSAPPRDKLPSKMSVVEGLEAALRTVQDIDVITFSGNGEPTLHPDFGEMVDGAMEVRDRYAPEKPLAVLSSGATLRDARVRTVLNNLDLRIMKLDVGDQAAFREVNRPISDLLLEDIVRGLRGLEDVVLQVLLVRGPRENSSPERIAQLIDRVAEISPMAVQLYTLVRPPAEECVEAVPRDALREAAERIERDAGVKVTVH